MKNCLVLMTLLLATACTGGTVRDNLGLSREAPDEFRVVSRPPLSVPPEFTLRPPMPGEAPRGVPESEDSARALLLKDTDSSTTRILEKSSVDTAVDPVLSGSLNSSAESNFLSHAGTSEADTNIRQILNEDTKLDPAPQEDVSPLESLMGATPSDPVVDPKAEAQRIRENKDEGKPVTEGEVKTEDPKKKSVLDKLFE